MKYGMPKIITNSLAGHTTPSIVAVSQTMYGHSYPEKDFITNGKYNSHNSNNSDDDVFDAEYKEVA